MKKTAINKCPLCGGAVDIQADVSVRITCRGDDSFLSTETEDIIQQVNNIIVEHPDEYECTCNDCERDLQAKPLGYENYEISVEIETMTAAFETNWHVTKRDLPTPYESCYLAVKYEDEEALIIMLGYYNLIADKFFCSVNRETFTKEQVKFWTAQIETPDISIA